MRKLAFQPSDVDPSTALSRRNSLRRHATPDFLLASPADHHRFPLDFHRGSNVAMSSPSPDMPSFHFGPPFWRRAESVESDDCSGGGDNESSLEHLNSCEDDEEYSSMEDITNIISSQGIVPPASGYSMLGFAPVGASSMGNIFPSHMFVPGPSSQSKPSPQLSLVRRGSQDSTSSGVRILRSGIPATPRIVHNSGMPAPGGATPANTGGVLDTSSSLVFGSVKHGRPMEAMCVDPFERKKRKVPVQGSVESAAGLRFRSEYTEIELIGKGSFSDVFRAKSKLDGQVYAIKRIKRQCSNDATKQAACQREASVLALLAQCADQDPILASHIIRYFSSWYEESRLFIQIEYCECNLADMLCGGGKRPVSVQFVTTVLKDVAMGLKFLHSFNLVHLDIKPANIFFSSSKLFKLGDLGLVVSAASHEPVEVTSGDARYLPREILLNNFKHLMKADIFSLGATVLECMLGTKLEAEGESWHQLRDGQIPREELKEYPPALVELIALMMHPDPVKRPSCDEILTDAGKDDIVLYSH